MKVTIQTADGVTVVVDGGSPEQVACIIEATGGRGRLNISGPTTASALAEVAGAGAAILAIKRAAADNGVPREPVARNLVPEDVREVRRSAATLIVGRAGEHPSETEHFSQVATVTCHGYGTVRSILLREKHTKVHLRGPAAKVRDEAVIVLKAAGFEPTTIARRLGLERHQVVGIINKAGG